jgi:glycerol-3-phosphate acyltransferase PlsX
VRVVVDAMGGDLGPAETVPGALAAASRFSIAITLVGRREEIERHLPRSVPPDVAIVDARDVISDEDAPTEALQTKKDASLVRALAELHAGRADVLVSAGNTGALVAGAVLTFGLFEGMRRPCLGAILPTRRRSPVLLVDAGGSVDSHPEQLVDSAILGSLYAEHVLGYPEPNVALLNIGTEPRKGNRLARAAFELLERAPVRFVGNMEARELVSGNIQVAVADGFVGNIVLKLAEGFGSMVFALLREELEATPLTRLAGALVRPRLARLRDSLDYQSYGGAPLFGPKAPIIKCHGSSRARAIMNGVRVANEFAASGVIGLMAERLRGRGGAVRV